MPPSRRGAGFNNMNQLIRVMAIGDIVGQEAVSLLEAKLRSLRRSMQLDLVVCNAENAAIGNGLDRQSANRLFTAGVDVITSGNHIWQKKDMYACLDENPHVLRPANYPPEAPGSGACLIDADGVRFLVMNVLGTVFMEPLSCPFQTVERLLAANKGKYDISLLDIHAEATSEKIALANCFDGMISAVWGTHTHVQTADAHILPHGTGYITDLGMTGPSDSVLGVKTELIIRKLRTHMPVRFEIAEGNVHMSGAVFSLNRNTGMAEEVAPFNL